jgi:hypothetical protein
MGLSLGKRFERYCGRDREHLDACRPASSRRGGTFQVATAGGVWVAARVVLAILYLLRCGSGSGVSRRWRKPTQIASICSP